MEKYAVTQCDVSFLEPSVYMVQIKKPGQKKKEKSGQH